jgi:hypothetical protein
MRYGILGTGQLTFAPPGTHGYSSGINIPMNTTLDEQELYDKLNAYRTQFQADSLTPFDIQQFIRTCQIHDVEENQKYLQYWSKIIFSPISLKELE